MVGSDDGAGDVAAPDGAKATVVAQATVIAQATVVAWSTAARTRGFEEEPTRQGENERASPRGEPPLRKTNGFWVRERLRQEILAREVVGTRPIRLHLRWDRQSKWGSRRR